MDDSTRQTTGSTPLPTQQQIAQRAREIWIARGQPTGCDVEIWLEAERDLQLPARSADTSPTATPASAAPPAKPTPEPDAAVEPGTQGVRKTKRGKRTLQQKIEEDLPRGGYGDGGHMHVGPSA